MSGYDVDALIEAFVPEEARDALVEGLRDAYEHTNPFSPNREADLIVENWLPPILDRVKREAAAQALEEAANEVEETNFAWGKIAFVGELRARARAARKQVNA